MKALAMASSVPAKRFNDADPSASKKHKLERSSSNPYLDEVGRGQLPDWALKNNAFPGSNQMGNSLISAVKVGAMGSNPTSRPSSAGSSLSVSQDIDLGGPAPTNSKANKDADSTKLDVDSMMDATAYGGVDLKVRVG